MSELQQYKCPSCGGSIEFDSNLQKMKCPYCDTEYDIETLKHYDEDLKKDTEDQMEWENSAGSEWQEGEEENITVYVCDSCGGEIITDQTTAASSCPYCGNPVIMKGRLSGELRPDYVIPFKLDKKSAVQALKNHYKNKILLPKVFKDENHIQEIKGVYVPVWLFDADVDASVRYKATKVRSWSSSDYIYTETKHFSVTRSGRVCFDCVPVDGSSKMNDDMMESIEPFDFKQAVDFRTAYLSGYLADKYDVNEEQSRNRANERVKNTTEQLIRNTVNGYNTVTQENSSVKYNNSKAKYALYPVWLLTTKWKDKNYLFAMNGQTGKFVGDLPIDNGLRLKWFFSVFGISAVLMTAAAWIMYLL